MDNGNRTNRKQTSSLRNNEADLCSSEYDKVISNKPSVHGILNESNQNTDQQRNNSMQNGISDTKSERSTDREILQETSTERKTNGITEPASENQQLHTSIAEEQREENRNDEVFRRTKTSTVTTTTTTTRSAATSGDDGTIVVDNSGTTTSSSSITTINTVVIRRIWKRIKSQSITRTLIETLDWIVFFEEDDPKQINSITYETRLKTFRFFFFIIFCIDIALNIYKSPTYDSTLIDVPHFSFFHYLPAVTPERVVVLWCMQSYLAFQVAFGLQMRWTVPLMCILNFYTYFCSRLDSYQHHYLLWWILFILSTVDWRNVKAWSIRLVLVQLSFVYFFAAVTKLDYLFRVQEILPIQINIWWLHKFISYTSIYLGLPNDHLLWWFAGFGVILLEFFLTFAIHTKNETLRTIAWFSGMIFHLMANLSSLHIRAFSYYMFALYILIAPDFIVRISNVGIPSTIRNIVVGFLRGVILVIMSSEDDDDDEYDRVIIRNSIEREVEERRHQQQQQQQQDLDPTTTPKWKHHTPPPHRRRPERAGWCLRIVFFIFFSILLFNPFAPASIRFIVWLIVCFISIKRPRQLTRLWHLVFGYKNSNRYPWWFAGLIFMIASNWSYVILKEVEFPVYHRVTTFNCLLWIMSSIRTEHSRTYYTISHLIHSYILLSIYFGNSIELY